MVGTDFRIYIGMAVRSSNYTGKRMLFLWTRALFAHYEIEEGGPNDTQPALNALIACSHEDWGHCSWLLQ